LKAQSGRWKGKGMTRVSLFVFILIIPILAAQTLLFGRTVPRADDYVSLRQASLAEYQMGNKQQ
jgi:hypothetical protein